MLWSLCGIWGCKTGPNSGRSPAPEPVKVPDPSVGFCDVPLPPWWLHYDPNLSSAVITYENIPSAFLEDAKNFEHPIFPLLDLSVTDFLDNPISPLPDASTVSLSWSHERPQQTPSPALLLALPLPSLKQIDSFFRVARPQNAASLSINSLRFDLSLGPILSTWFRVIIRWGEWHEAMEWLELALQHEPAFRKEFKKTRNNLNKISWNGDLTGSGDSTGSLACFLSEEWLSSSNIDHLCQPLRSEQGQMRGSVIKIQSPYWMESLRRFHDRCEAGALLYDSAMGWRTLCKQGMDVVTGAIHYVAGVANINENHWISYILDGLRVILVGDSLLEGGEATLERGERAKIINLLRWWMRQSWKLVGKTPSPIPSSSLNVQRQQDSSSCGIYAFNSIATFFKPKVYPRLALSSLQSTRAKLFNSIIEHHHSMQVCNVPPAL